MRGSKAVFHAAVALNLAAMAGLACAQDIRDPTVPPPMRDSSSPQGSPIGVEETSVIVRDGKPYLVVGTRLYAPGDKVGTFRVDRITETEVWLHDGSKRIAVPRFAGIERKARAPERRCAPTDTQQNAPIEGAPCEDTQP